jgi:hypothetical protein
MLSLDVFNQDPFTTIQLTMAVERQPYRPQMLGDMGIFEVKPIRTKVLMVEQRQGVLVLIPFTDRGAPGTQRQTELRQARHFAVPRIRMEDTIYADELQSIREFGSESELMQLQKEMARRLVGPTGLRSNIEFTREFHRLAAIQGLLLDASGAVKFNWFNEFGYAVPAEIAFNFAALSAAFVSSQVDGLRPICNEIVRQTKRAAQGAWIDGRTRVVGLAGDAFFDTLISTPMVRGTYLNWVQAEQLRQNLAFEPFSWGGIDWVNYRGSDDINGQQGTATASSGTIACPGITSTLNILGVQTSVVGLGVTGPGIPAGSSVLSVVPGVSFTLANSVVANQSTSGVYNFGPGAISIPSNKCKFFPRQSAGVFQVAYAPGESAEWVNTMGKPEYVRVIPDRDRNEYAKFEMTSYPLHICTRPEVLNSGTMDSTAD